MEILAIVIIGFAWIQLGVALSNLPLKFPEAAPEELYGQLSILIPARNEEKTLPLLLHDLLEQHPHPLEIIICDDHSEDQTYALASKWTGQYSCLRIFRGEELPPGWLGKNFACYQLARQARGNYLLFLDADVRIGEQGILPVLSLAKQKGTALLSVFPRQMLLTPGEKATVPLMTYILLTLLPLRLVYRVPRQSALAAANGQFMLFEAASYRQIQPHRVVRSEAVEDVAISRLYKKWGRHIACLTGISEISCRMYTSRREAISGFARNIAGFFGGSLLLALLFWLLTGWGWLVVLQAFSWSGLLAYLVLRTVIRLVVAYDCRQPAGTNVFYSVFQQGNMGLILGKAWKSRRKGVLKWKGRNILNP